MSCLSWSCQIAQWNSNLNICYYIFKAIHKHCYPYRIFHVGFSPSNLKMSVSRSVLLLAWRTAVCFCGLIDNVMAATETQSGLAYWCSYNLDTLQGLMSILTWLSLWPHFLLLGDSDGAVCMLMHLGNMPHMCALFACEKKNGRKTMRMGVSVCLNVASKLTLRPFPVVH